MANPVPVIPPEGKRSVIDVSHVRHYIYDRTVSDNPLELDLQFSDEEIGYAMQFAAMRYNEIPPYVQTVDPAALPFAATFLAGICYHLCLGLLFKLQRNDLDYSAGNVTVDINKRRIEHLKQWLKMFGDEFEQRAKEIKMTINLHAAFASY